MKKKNIKKKSDEDFLQEEFDFSHASQGSIISGKGVKLPVSIRLDSDVIDYFKHKAEALGSKAKYQTLINEALKEYISGLSIQKLLLSDEFVKTLSKGLTKYGGLGKNPPRRRAS